MSKQSRAPLPVKNGVNPSCIYLPNVEDETVFDFFCNSFPHIKPSDCQQRFEQKEVRFETGEIVSLNTPFIKGAKIYYYRELPSEIKVPFNEKVLFENERFLIVDKPHFLPVAPSGNYLHETLIVRLRKNLKQDDLELCHRLDRETAGLVLVIKQKEYRASYHRLFSERKIKKIYHAISTLPPDTMKFPIEKKSSIVKSQPFFLMRENSSVESSSSSISESKIELLERGVKRALYKLTPKTGKKHQLRVHMASVGLPILNDSFYPKLINKDSNDFSKPLQLLAKSLSFVDPFDRKLYDFDSSFELTNV